MVAFNKDSGTLAEEYEARWPELTSFRLSFGLSPEDPAIYSYDVTPGNKDYVQSLLDIPIDLDKYDYQIEQGRTD